MPRRPTGPINHTFSGWALTLLTYALVAGAIVGMFMVGGCATVEAPTAPVLNYTAPGPCSMPDGSEGHKAIVCGRERVVYWWPYAHRVSCYEECVP